MEEYLYFMSNCIKEVKVDKQSNFFLIGVILSSSWKTFISTCARAKIFDMNMVYILLICL